MSRVHVLIAVLSGALVWLVLIVTEARKSAKPTRVRHAIALVALALMLTSYLTRGHLIPGDGHSHLARTWLIFDALRTGELPLWSHRWYMGFPSELHYGPLYYWLSALVVALLGGKLYFATKLLLWLVHLASAAAAYALGMARYDDRSTALVLALGYALCGYHLDALRTDGKLPMSLVFLAAPLLFAQREWLARGAERGGSASTLRSRARSALRRMPSTAAT